jgi:hypothetical protein
MIRQFHRRRKADEDNNRGDLDFGIDIDGQNQVRFRFDVGRMI